MAGTLQVPTTGTVTGLTMAGDINTAVAAVAVDNQGASAPTTTGTGLSSTAGVHWHDTSANLDKVRDQADSTFIIRGAYDETGKGYLPYKRGVPIAGIAQIVGNETGAVQTGSTVLPNDDTIPQNTEGDQYLSQAITPANASSILLIDVTLVLTNAGGNQEVIALFQDATAGALAAVIGTPAQSGAPSPMEFRHRMTAGTTSATTFKVRAGNAAGSQTTINGTGAARLLGGVMASSITITEILP